MNIFSIFDHKYNEIMNMGPGASWKVLVGSYFVFLVLGHGPFLFSGKKIFDIVVSIKILLLGGSHLFQIIVSMN